MARPQVVVNLFASVDGRITTAPGRNVAEWTAAGLDAGANDLSHRLYDDLDCDALVSGSDSIVVFGGHQVAAPQHYWPKKSKAYVVVDGQGKIDWAHTDGLLVITRRNVRAEYVAQLDQKQVRRLYAGEGEHVDLHDALAQLYAQGFRRVGLTGGGALNGAFLRAGLVDEISLVIAPVAVGGRRTATVFDAPDLSSLDGITRLLLLNARPIGDQGAVWLHYRTVSSTVSPSASV